MRKALSMVATLLIAVGASACEKHSTEAPPAPRLASHRAIYELSLAHANSRSQVGDVSGKLVVEWQDTCQGYITNQRFLTQFNNVDGGAVLSDLAVSSWESADGSRFRFNVVNTINGKLEDRSQGEARRNAKTGAASVSFDVPAGKSEELPAGTIFPTEHMAGLLQAARSGEHMFVRTLFDGSYEDGLSTVSAFIGKARAAAAKPAADPPAQSPAGDEKARALLEGQPWPVRMAFYGKSGEAPGDIPDYEFALDLRENGVATALQFDYGDFMVAGKLIQIEPLTGCEAAPAATPTN